MLGNVVALRLADDCEVTMIRKVPHEYLSIAVTAELKRALRKQAKRAGMSLSKWVGTRLELEGPDPDEIRALLMALKELSDHTKESAIKFEEFRAKQEVTERALPARLAAVRAEAEREFRGWGL